MPVQVVIEKSKQLEEGVWIGILPPHEAQMLGKAPRSVGPTTVLLTGQAELDEGRGNLIFDAGDASLANQGTSSRTIVIATALSSERQESQHPETDDLSHRDGYDTVVRSQGDEDFLQELDILPDDPRRAGKELLRRVRVDFPGYMERGKRRNFSNRPDNFWYVVVQPNKGNLSITVRGRPERFEGSALSLKDDRPGYTRFYVTGLSDVDDAFALIQDSKRRR